MQDIGLKIEIAQLRLADAVTQLTREVKSMNGAINDLRYMYNSLKAEMKDAEAERQSGQKPPRKGGDR